MLFKQFTSMGLVAGALLAGGCRCGGTPSTGDPGDTSGAVDTAPTVEWFPDASSALAAVISRTHPRGIGFGEYHQQTQTEGVTSALKRFTVELLPGLGELVTDLVVETWISTGKCGEEERTLTKEVDAVTQRPAATEDETVALIRAAAGMGIKPRVLELACDDYGRLQGDAGIDYLGLLELVGERLGATAMRAVEERLAAKGTSPSAGDGVVAVFGGAIHNDADPVPMWRSVAYGPSLAERVERYVEVDLIVPEFVEGSEIARKEPWYPVFEMHVSTSEVLLIQTGASAFALVFEKGVSRP